MLALLADTIAGVCGNYRRAGKFIFKRFNPALDSKLQTAGPWRPLLVSMLQRDPAERVTMREAYAHALQIADAEGLPPLPEQPFPDEVPQELLARLWERSGGGAPEDSPLEVDQWLARERPPHPDPLIAFLTTPSGGEEAGR